MSCQIPNLLLAVLLAGVAHGQDGPAPGKTGDSPAPTSDLAISYEVFSLPLAEAATWRRQELGDVETYDRLVAQLESGKVKQESLTVLRCPSGHQACTEAVTRPM
jgi:hypothetical protein